ncbi:Fe-S cluster assembly sulfur transfer protein SufU [Gemmatimonadota bacterium]
MTFDELYQEIILDHYRSPKNKCNGGDNGKICVKHENPLCGDELSLSIELSEDETIDKICFSGHGCAISQASASMMTEAVKGSSIDQALDLIESVRLMMHGEAPVRELGDIETLKGVADFPVRIKCALLAWMALKDALNSSKLSAEMKHPHG